MWWLATMALAEPLEQPQPPEQPAVREPVRTTNPGLGLGLTSLVSTGDLGLRSGLLLDFRTEAALHRSLQFNFTLGLGITRPQNTVLLFGLGLDLGIWTTRAFGNVADWMGKPAPEPLVPFKVMGVMFAYMGLGMCYLAVPVIWMVSPLASVGHSVLGPTLSWHSDRRAPNVFVEGGFGGALYGHPAGSGPNAGVGPLLGVGSQIGKQSIAMRVWLSPATWNTGEDTVLSASVVVGL